ncbi:MAG: RNA pyrophosphohydrolase [Cypionkella sp.]|nr:RNA pyrophosphohydrolase [Cypionkella sp.]
MPADPSSLPYRPCVGVMLINGAGQIWAGQRIDTQATAWQMPQGGIDADEAPLEAAYRELHEETGITADLVHPIAQTEDWLTYDLPADLIGKVWKGKYRGQKQKWVLMRFHGRDDQISIDRDHPEFAAWKWIDSDEMIAAIVPFKRAVYEQVVAAFAPHLAKSSQS